MDPTVERTLHRYSVSVTGTPTNSLRSGANPLECLADTVQIENGTLMFWIDDHLEAAFAPGTWLRVQWLGSDDD